MRGLIVQPRDVMPDGYMVLLLGVAAQALRDARGCSHRPGANGAEGLAYLNDAEVRELHQMVNLALPTITAEILERKTRIYQGRSKGGRPKGAKDRKPRKCKASKGAG